MALACCAIVLALPAGPAAAQGSGKVRLGPSDGSDIVGVGFGRVTDSQRLQLVDVESGDNGYPVVLGGYYGLLNRRGDLILRPLLEWADFDYDRVVRVVYRGRTGFIDLSGNEQVRPDLTWADRFQEDLAVVSADPDADPADTDFRERGLPLGEPGDGPVRFIYRTGRPAAGGVVFDQARRFKDGVAAVQRDGACGFIDVRGSVVVPPEFTGVRSFHDNLAAVAQGWDDAGRLARFAYINRTGKVQHRFGPEVTLIGDFNDGMAWVRVRARDGQERFGYLNRRFKLEVPPRFERARDFTDGVAAVRYDGKWGYIDRRGVWVVQPVFDNADDFDDTLAPVQWNGQWGYIDRTGARRSPFNLSRADPFFRELARAAGPEPFGYLDLAIRAVFDPRQGRLGIRDNTRQADFETARAVVNDRGIPDFVSFPLDRNRDPVEVYPPDHLYDEGLPMGAWNGYRTTDAPAPLIAAPATAPASRR
ncbi:MAG: WG repeat-containing protein [Planctomycetota bacterium]